MKNIKIFSVLMVLFFTYNACKKQSTTKDEPQNENELITSVKLNFVDTSMKDTFTYEWSQKGGPGTLISVDTIQLAANKSYVSFIEILDESKTPVFVVSEEIKKEANYHRFVYSSSTSRFGAKITDFDTHVPPIELGLRFISTTNSIGQVTGNLNVTLKHYTDSDPKTGGLSAGTTDIAVDFPIEIQ